MSTIKKSHTNIVKKEAQELTKKLEEDTYFQSLEAQLDKDGYVAKYVAVWKEVAYYQARTGMIPPKSLRKRFYRAQTDLYTKTDVLSYLNPETGRYSTV